MIFIKNLTKITEEKYSIGYVHYMPFDEKNGLNKSKEKLEQEGILVESIPDPKQIEEKQAVMYWNPIKKEICYEYEDIPKSKEEIKNDKINTLVQTITQLNLKNKQKDIMATTLAQTMASLNLRLNKLEKEKEGR